MQDNRPANTCPATSRDRGSVLVGPTVRHAVGERTTHAFSRSPLSRASRPFIGPILKGSKGSIWPVRQAVGERPPFAHGLNRLRGSRGSVLVCRRQGLLLRHARATTIKIASMHARAVPAAKALRAVALFLRGLAKNAEQLTNLQRWREILARAFRVFLLDLSERLDGDPSDGAVATETWRAKLAVRLTENGGRSSGTAWVCQTGRTRALETSGATSRSRVAARLTAARRQSRNSR